MNINGFKPTLTVRYDNHIGSLPHMTYFGGKVLKDSKLVSLFYGDFWGTAKGKGEMAFQNSFAAELMKSSYMSIWAQYGARPSKLIGSDTPPVENQSYVTDSDIQAMIKNEIQGGKVNPPDGKTIYTVYLPPKVILEAPDGSSSREGLGGYHGSFVGTNGKKVYYAAIVYSEKKNGIDFTGKGRDNMTIAASHEWTEAVTDPDVNHGKLGWYDKRYGEVGDVPIMLGMPLREVYGKVGRFYAQKEWSEVDGAVELQAKHPAPVKSVGSSVRLP